MTWLLFAGAVLALCATLWTSLAARALRSFSRHELELILRHRREEAALGEVLAWNDRAALLAECLHTLSALVAAIAAAFWIDRRFAGRPWSETFWYVALAVAALAASVWIPHGISQIAAARFVYRQWRLWRFVGRALYPLVAVGLGIERLIRFVAGGKAQIREEESLHAEIRTIVDEAHREGVLEGEAREMIEGVMLLQDVHVGEVMVPRTDMMCLPVSTGRAEALKYIAESGHSRVPVYDNSRDDIVGILHLRDLLAEGPDGQESPEWNLRSAARPPLFVPEAKPLDELLREFRDSRQHMAVVLNEYGGVSGLVTMEDVLEEIVGEIADETDTEHDAADGIRIIDERTSDVRARVHIDELNERLGLALPDDRDFDTVGGLIFAELGRLPRLGESLMLGNVRLTVTETSRRRVERVRLEIVEEPQNEPAA